MDSIEDTMWSTAGALWKASLGRAPLRKTLRYLLVPVEYTRTREIPVLLALSGLEGRKDEDLAILDVSSPQILGLTLARMSPRWRVVYGNPFAPEREDMALGSAILGCEGLEVLDFDVCSAEQSDRLVERFGRFDVIVSCSVFEHLHPEADGDAAAAANLARLLKPGGKALLSVPYWREGFSEYRKGGAYGQATGTAERIFFQRFYDEERIREFLVEPSGLRREASWYVGEEGHRADDIHDRYAHRVGGPLVRVALGRLYRRLAARHLTAPTADPASLRKPYLAFLRLAA